MQQLNIDIYAVTVCVNYSHYLKYCVSNKRFFKRWVIVTVEDDKDTIKLCEENNLEYIFSKTLYDRKFFKSGAINEGLDHLGYEHDWYLHIDADIIIKDNFTKNFHENKDGVMCINGYRNISKKTPTGYFDNNKKIPVSIPIADPKINCVFCLERDDVNVSDLDDSQLSVPLSFDLMQERKFLGHGYFQLFNMKKIKKVYPELMYIYPKMSVNAGADDVIFRNMFFTLVSLKSRCIHLSEIGVNWDGI